MKLNNPKSWGAALGAGLLATTLMLPQARGELVYDSTEKGEAPQAAAAPQVMTIAPQQAAAAPTTQVVRVQAPAAEAPAAVAQQPAGATTVIIAPMGYPAPSAQSAPAQAAPVAQAPAPAPIPAFIPAAAPAPVAAPVAAVAPVAAPTPAALTADPQNMTQAELTRRERLRAELKNEDSAQQRLEELRLRDERRRTDEMLQASSPSPAITPKVEIVTAPATEQPSAAPVVVTAGASSHVSTTVAAPSDSEKTPIALQIMGGLPLMTGNSYLNMSPHYALGIGFVVGATDYVSLEGGYSYAESGVGMSSAGYNPSYYGYSAYSGYGYNNGYSSYSNPYGQYGSYGATLGSTYQLYSLKQNVADLGLRLNVLGPDSRIRPFVGGGAAYARSFVNYNSATLSTLNSEGYQAYAGDYTLDQFFGTASVGLDVKLSRSISINALARYYALMASAQNESSYATADKAYVGNALATTSFFTLESGLSFTF